MIGLWLEGLSSTKIDQNEKHVKGLVLKQKKDWIKIAIKGKNNRTL